MTILFLIIALIMLLIVIFAGIWLSTISEELLNAKKKQKELDKRIQYIKKFIASRED